MNLMEAFKALDQLNEDVFSVDAEGIKKLNDFMQNDDSVDELSVFDIDSTEDDVIRDDEECNEGDMILDCCVCHSKVFKPASEIVVDEESQIANAGEECPYCFSVEGLMNARLQHVCCRKISSTEIRSFPALNTSKS